MIARCFEFYYDRPTDWLAISVWLGYVILIVLKMLTRL